MNVSVQVLGIEYHLPERIVTNDDLGRENPDWQMEGLYAKVGISERRVAALGETASDLALTACKKLLDREIVPRGRVDYLIFCTQSPDYYLPSAACVLQDRLGLSKNLGAFDFNLGCSGYVYGLGLAKALISSGQAKYVLLATGDTYSKYIHPHDRAVRVLFGDGATATLVGPTSQGPGQIGAFVFCTDGSGYKNLIVPAGGLRLPKSEATAEERTDAAECTRSDDNLFMDGTAIFAFAVTSVPKLIRDLLGKVGVNGEDVDWYVYHQANKFMLEELAKRSKVPAEKLAVNYEKVGNTVSSSIPLVLKDYVSAGKIKSGHKVMLIGFGVGYSWAGCVLTWGADA